MVISSNSIKVNSRYLIVFLFMSISSITLAEEKIELELPINKNGILNVKQFHKVLKNSIMGKNEFRVVLKLDNEKLGDDFYLYQGNDENTDKYQIDKPILLQNVKGWTPDNDSLNYYYEFVKRNPEYKIELMKELGTAADELNKKLERSDAKNYNKKITELKYKFNLAYNRTRDSLFTKAEIDSNHATYDNWLDSLQTAKVNASNLNKWINIEKTLISIFGNNIEDNILSTVKPMETLYNSLAQDATLKKLTSDFKNALYNTEIDERLTTKLKDKKNELENLTAIVNVINKTQTEHLQLTDIGTLETERKKLIERKNKLKSEIKRFTSQIEKQFEIDELLYRGILTTYYTNTKYFWEFPKMHKRHIALVWDAKDLSVKPIPFETTLHNQIVAIVENAESKYTVAANATDIKQDQTIFAQDLIGDEEVFVDILHETKSVEDSVFSIEPDTEDRPVKTGEIAALDTSLYNLLKNTKKLEREVILSINPDNYKPKRDKTPKYRTEAQKIIEIKKAPVYVELTLTPQKAKNAKTTDKEKDTKYKAFFRVNRTRHLSLRLGIVYNLAKNNIITQNPDSTFTTVKNKDRGIDPIIGVHLYWRRIDPRHKSDFDYVPSPFIGFNLRSLQDNLYLGFATEYRGLVGAFGLNLFRTDVEDVENNRIRKTYETGYFASIMVDPSVFKELIKSAIGL